LVPIPVEHDDDGGEEIRSHWEASPA